MLLDVNRRHPLNSYWGLNDRGTLKYTSCTVSAPSLAVDQNFSIYSKVELRRGFIISVNWPWHSAGPNCCCKKCAELEKNGFTFWLCDFEWFYILTSIKCLVIICRCIISLKCHCLADNGGGGGGGGGIMTVATSTGNSTQLNEGTLNVNFNIRLFNVNRNSKVAVVCMQAMTQQLTLVFWSVPSA